MAFEPIYHRGWRSPGMGVHPGSGTAWIADKEAEVYLRFSGARSRADGSRIRLAVAKASGPSFAVSVEVLSQGRSLGRNGPVEVSASKGFVDLDISWLREPGDHDLDVRVTVSPSPGGYVVFSGFRQIGVLQPSPMLLSVVPDRDVPVSGSYLAAASAWFSTAAVCPEGIGCLYRAEIREGELAWILEEPCGNPDCECPRPESLPSLEGEVYAAQCRTPLDLPPSPPPTPPSDTPSGIIPGLEEPCSVPFSCGPGTPPDCRASVTASGRCVDTFGAEGTGNGDDAYGFRGELPLIPDEEETPDISDPGWVWRLDGGTCAVEGNEAFWFAQGQPPLSVGDRFLDLSFWSDSYGERGPAIWVALAISATASRDGIALEIRPNWTPEVGILTCKSSPSSSDYQAIGYTSSATPRNECNNYRRSIILYGPLSGFSPEDTHPSVRVRPVAGTLAGDDWVAVAAAEITTYTDSVTREEALAHAKSCGVIRPLCEDSEPECFEPEIREMVLPEALHLDSDGWTGTLDTLVNAQIYMGDWLLALKSLPGKVGNLCAVVFPEAGLEAEDFWVNILAGAVSSSILMRVVYRYEDPDTGEWIADADHTFLVECRQGRVYREDRDDAVRYTTHSMRIVPEFPVRDRRTRIDISSLGPEADDGLAGLWIKSVTIAHCGLVPFIEADSTGGSPPISLETISGSPPIQGEPDPFVPGGAEFPQCPPGPPSEPPAGGEILRPNRDIRVAMFRPRPAWQILNDPVAEACEDCQTLIGAPAEEDVFDEVGERIGHRRSSVEVGFTEPADAGPWNAVIARICAARSRPPDEDSPEPPGGCGEPLMAPCPPSDVVRPFRTVEGRGWHTNPLHLRLGDPSWQPDGCYVSREIDVSLPGAAVVGFGKPEKREDGYRAMTLRMRARAIAGRRVLGSNRITKVGGNPSTFSGIGGYQVRWEPYVCEPAVRAEADGSFTAVGSGRLRSNIRADVVFGFVSPSDDIEIAVGTDGVAFSSRAQVSIESGGVAVVYFRIRINQHGKTTSGGQHQIGAWIVMDGPLVVTTRQMLAPPVDVPLAVDVDRPKYEKAPLSTVVRLGVRPSGHPDLAGFPRRWAGPLTERWRDFHFSWTGIYSSEAAELLRFEIQPSAGDVGEDEAAVEIEFFEVGHAPHCPGLAPAEDSAEDCETWLAPAADLSAVGWSPLPAAPRLLGDLRVPDEIYVSVDPRAANSLTLSMSVEKRPPFPSIGRFHSVTVAVTARVRGTRGSTATLRVATSLGDIRSSGALSREWRTYAFTWEYLEGLTASQAESLRVFLEGRATSAGEGELKVDVRSVRVYGRCEGSGVLPSPSPPGTTQPSPPPASCRLESFPSSVEVHSWGSAVGFGRSHRPSFRIRAINESGDDGVLDFTAGGNLQWEAIGGPVVDVPQGQVVDVDVFAHVGDSSDPFPISPESGAFRLVLSCPGEPDDVREISWHYDGGL
jgi:hypothetical protein